MSSMNFLSDTLLFVGTRPTARYFLAPDSRAARCRPSSGAVCGSPKVGALCTVCRSTVRVMEEPGSSSAMAFTGTRWCFLAKPITPHGDVQEPKGPFLVHVD